MNVLFVCTGNTCRSPMAEGYLNSLGLPNVNAKSAGMSFSGDPVAENSAKAMLEVGIDISSHRSAVITPSHIQWADKIICMTASHKNALESLGAVGNKLSVLGDGIPDPFGQDLSVYRECRDMIIKAIDKLFKEDQLHIEIMSDEAKADDIEIIEKECFSSPWSKKAITESFSHGTLFLLGVIDGKTVGYMGLSSVLDEGYVTNIAVLPEYRNKGVASSLLELCIKEAQSKELSFISLEVRCSNQKAIRLYEKYGFKTEGQRKNFYTSPNEDALIMTRRFK